MTEFCHPSSLPVPFAGIRNEGEGVKGSTQGREPMASRTDGSLVFCFIAWDGRPLRTDICFLFQRLPSSILPGGLSWHMTCPGYTGQLRLRFLGPSSLNPFRMRIPATEGWEAKGIFVLTPSALFSPQEMFQKW